MAKSNLETAAEAVQFAREVRKLHAKITNPGDRQRETDIFVAQQRITAAMRPIRSKLVSVNYWSDTSKNHELEDRLRDASRELQSERRKLWKLRNNTQHARHEALLEDVGV